MKEKFFWVLIILVAIPPIIWLTMMPLADRFGNSSLTFLSLGRLTGIIGMTLLSVNIILTTRGRFLDNLFGGLNKVYLNHHLIGSIAFILLLFHPLALAVNLPFLLLDLTRPDLIFGKAALFLMMVLLGITFYLKLSYQKWKWTHKLLGLVLVLAVIHIFWVSSDISQSLLLRLYLLVFNLTALICYTYRSVFPEKLVNRLVYSVEGVNKVGPEILELVLKPLAKPLDFLAGQFVFIKITDPSIPFEEHPFSISSAPTEKNLRLTLKEKGDYTQKLKNLSHGSDVFIEGPFGKFSSSLYSGKEQIWIAGGIGITPFLSMARNLVSLETTKKINLFYSVSQSSEAIYLEELEKIEKIKMNFKFFLHSTQVLGRLSADYIMKQMETLKNPEIFICGPTLMMKNLRTQFRQKGVYNKNIHSEEFEL